MRAPFCFNGTAAHIPAQVSSPGESYPEALCELCNHTLRPERLAALEVVKSRIDQCGLGQLCLELHSNKANKREVLSELYLARVWIVLVPRKNLSAKASRTEPIPSSSRVSLPPSMLMMLSIVRRSFSEKSAHER